MWDSLDLMWAVADGAPVSRAMAAADPGPEWLRTRRPRHLLGASYMGPGIANCQTPPEDPEVADLLQTTPQFVRHAGVHFNAEVWWEDDLFHSVVWVYGQPRGYHTAPVLADLVREVNDQWGWD